MARDDGGPAFPRTPSLSTNGQEGMSLRDYFAAKVLAGMIASYSGENVSLPDDDYAAKRAYRYADAMLKERLK